MSIFCLGREVAESKAKSSDFASILDPLLEYIIVFIALSDNLEQPNLPLHPASLVRHLVRRSFREDGSFSDGGRIQLYPPRRI